MGFFTRVKKGYGKAKEYVEKKQEEKRLTQLLKAKRQAKEAAEKESYYNEMAKAEKQKADANKAKEKYQKYRSKGGGSGFFSGAGKAIDRVGSGLMGSPGKNPLMGMGGGSPGFFAAAGNSTSRKRKPGKKRYTIIKGKAYEIGSKTKRTKRASKPQDFESRLKNLL